MRSPFRPDVAPDAAILDDHKPLITSLERRGLISGALSLGALVLLTGCDVKRPETDESAMLAISRLNDGVQALLFDPHRLAPTYPASRILRPPKFNAYYDVMDVKPVNGETWRLEVSGLVADKRAWTLQDLHTLPQTSMVIKHICVEGWSYIGGWSGPTLRGFLEHVGADLRAKYVAFKTADDYPSSIDMATALHPQTLLATAYGGDTLADPFGYPVRLRMATKLGYKNPQVDHGHRSHEHVCPWWLLGREGLPLVCRAYDTCVDNPGSAWCGLAGRGRECGPFTEHYARGYAATAGHELGSILRHAVPAVGSGRRSHWQGGSPSCREPGRPRQGSSPCSRSRWSRSW